MAIGEVILDCFLDYIGIESCLEPYPVNIPESGLYIADLPGITNAVIQAMTKAENETYLITWNKLQNRAILSFRTRLLAEVNKCLKINKMDTVECLACEFKDLFAVALQNLLANYILFEAINNWNLSRYSTVERIPSTDLMNYYAEQFEVELRAAVKGINILDTDCIELDKQCRIYPNGRISTQESLM